MNPIFPQLLSTDRCYNASELGFLITAVELLISGHQDNIFESSAELWITVEDKAGMLPQSQALPLLTELPIWHNGARGELSLLGEVTLGNQRVTLAQLIGAKTESRTEPRALSLRSAQAISISASQEFLSILQVFATKPTPQAMCPFWRERADKITPEPSYDDGASTASIDLLSAVAIQGYASTSESLECLRRLLSTQIKDSQHPDYGAIFIDPDDDYPGAGRATTLTNSMLLDVLAADASYLDLAESMEHGGFSIDDCLAFILRHQKPRGDWDLYASIPKEYYEPFVNINVSKSCQACFQLANAATKERIQAAIGQYLAYVSRFIDPETGACPPDPAATHTDAEVYTGLQIGLSLLYFAQLVRQRQELAKLGSLALNHACQNWTVPSSLASGQDKVSVRVPDAEGKASVNVINWEQPGVAKFVFYLLEAKERLEIDLPNGVADKLARAVPLIYSAASAGLWTDFLMPDKIQISNSAVCARALSYYVKYRSG